MESGVEGVSKEDQQQPDPGKHSSESFPEKRNDHQILTAKKYSVKDSIAANQFRKRELHGEVVRHCVDWRKKYEHKNIGQKLSHRQWFEQMVR